MAFNLTVIFPDEEPIQGSGSDVLVNTILRLGVDKVKALGLIAGNGYPLIGPNEEVPSNLVYRKDKETGYRIQTLKGEDARINMLKQIRSLLNEDFEIIVPQINLTSNKDNGILSVTFEGEIIDGEDSREVWINTLKRFGLKECFEAKATNKGYTIIKDVRPEHSTDIEEIDGYYVWCSINDNAKRKAILHIAEKLGKNVEVN